MQRTNAYEHINNLTTFEKNHYPLKKTKKTNRCTAASNPKNKTRHTQLKLEKWMSKMSMFIHVSKTKNHDN